MRLRKASHRVHIPRDEPSPRMEMLLAGPLPSTTLSDLSRRILDVVIPRGRAGITSDELLRKLGVAYHELMAALDDLSGHGKVPPHCPTPQSFSFFPST